MNEADIIGTKWMIVHSADDLGQIVYEFLDFGKVDYGDYSAEWKFENGLIRIFHNNGFAVLEGEITNDVLKGTASNKAGKEWIFEGRRTSKRMQAKTSPKDELKKSKVDEELCIENLFSIIKDYRADESNSMVCISQERIRIWINQFDQKDRFPILSELVNVFQKRYCSKAEIRSFIESTINLLVKDFNFRTVQDFLRNTTFLDLQKEGKSQGVMLSLLNELISEKYGMSIVDCGSTSKKHSVFLDDILCTGLTLISNLQDWANEIFEGAKTNKQAIDDDSTVLILAYVYVHDKNYRKKVAEMRYKISEGFSLKHKMYKLVEIENDISLGSKLDLLCPQEKEQPKIVNEYKNEVTKRVDSHTKQYGSISREEFYRPINFPQKEEFFTCSRNRVLMENVFLKKGVEILNNASAPNKNMRSLGYSIPSLKNFGFGALCFTWRNVPNNAPLVFWYSGGGFIPLFIVNRGSSF